MRQIAMSTGQDGSQYVAHFIRMRMRFGALELERILCQKTM
jgi:hypothetical protein